MKIEDRCNCDQTQELVRLLLAAREIIAEHVSINDGIGWMEDLHRSWAFPAEEHVPRLQGEDAQR